MQIQNDVLSFRTFAPDDADLRLFQQITDAIEEHRTIRFEFRKPGEKTADERPVKKDHLTG